jgi:uncharacterized protein with HEPN domain
MSPRTTRDWRLYADDIIDSCGKIRRVVSGMTREEFLDDDVRRDAVIRNIEIIGEAARHLPEELRAAAPQIPWRLVMDMRNLLAHAYFGVSPLVVWDTATTQVEELEKTVRAMLA